MSIPINLYLQINYFNINKTAESKFDIFLTMNHYGQVIKTVSLLDYSLLMCLNLIVNKTFQAIRKMKILFPRHH